MTRAESVDCSQSEIPDYQAECTSVLASDPSAAECTSDSECTSGENGQCQFENFYYSRCFCVYDECSTDDDCDVGLCTCGNEELYAQGHNVCQATGDCRTNDDCDLGLCMGHRGNGEGCYGTGPDITAWYCATSEDLCRSDKDCTHGDLCRWDQDHWGCWSVTTSCR